jgi:hypothetical protein
VKALQEYLRQQVRWTATNDAIFPWEAVLQKGHYRVRINNFPDELLYSLFVDGKHIGDFDDWPAGWKKGAMAGVSANSGMTKVSAVK